MVNIHNALKQALPDAMRAHDTARLNVIRGLMTAFTNELVATGHTPQEVLSDESANKVILRTIKQRQDAIEQFEKANRQDLADEDKAQLAILNEFAPEMASLEEVRDVAVKLKESMDGIDKSSMGKLIGAVKKELGDRGDGNLIKSVVEDLFK